MPIPASTTQARKADVVNLSKAFAHAPARLPHAVGAAARMNSMSRKPIGPLSTCARPA
jgi:hypothetical protein